MDLSKVIFLIACFTYLIALLASNFFSINLEQINLIDPLASIAIFTIGLFLLSILSFGKFSPIALAIAGFMQGKMFFENPATAVYIVPTIIAAYGGIIFGQALEKDLKEKKPEEKIFKKSAIILLIAIILSIVFYFGMAEITSAYNGLIEYIDAMSGSQNIPTNRLSIQI